MRLIRIIVAGLLLISLQLTAQIRLPKLISDGMVLQRDTELKIWGWASPNEEVSLQFNKKKYNTKANRKGSWIINLPAQKAGGPYEMKFSGKNKIKIENILFGDVWLGTGQSNMVLNMERLKEKYPNDIANADYPQIRNFFIDTSTNLTRPQADLNDGRWVTINPQTVLQMGGVTFFFARDLYEKYKIPIGIINSSVGGTPIQSWISEEGLQSFPDLATTVIKNKDTAAIHKIEQAQRDAIVIRPNEDKGLLQEPKWYTQEYKPKNWGTLFIPGYWEDQGLKDLNGVVWYRKELEIPARMAGQTAHLYMGRIVDADEAYINGQKIGNITYQYPPRRYTIPNGLLKEGKNVITLRISNYNGKGGFVPDKNYILVAGQDTLDLRGEWQYKVGEVFKPQKYVPSFSYQNQPASLYNAMIAPLKSYAIKGFVWYQGESNTGNPEPYGDYLQALIKDWRSQWSTEELPFLFVQLANFMDQDFLPVESNWAVLREEQRRSLRVPNTAMATAIDLGEWNDIHPLNKKELGLRLAKAARNVAYGEKDLVFSGPNYVSHEVQDGKIILNFEHVGSGLIAIDDELLTYFAIAGFDKEFKWAQAKIVGDQIEVSHPDIHHPMYVRYAWANNPASANLYNKEGLPASPFQTNTPKEEAMLWHGKEAAVVLTYDDALNVHLDNAIPELEAHHLKATFYLSGYFPGSRNRIADWRKAAAKGFELGNHTLYHPCDASLPGRDWVSPENDLSKYGTTRMLNEIRMNNVFLEALDGKKERTFAYTCGDVKTGDGSFVEAIKNDFVAARGVQGELNGIGSIDIQNVKCFVVNGETGPELIQWIKNAQAQNALITILFHGVVGEHDLNVSLEAHKQLLDYLAENKEDIWTTTMLEAAKHVKEHQ